MSTSPVSVLFARSDFVYKSLPGCDVWDASRDARLFSGSGPVVAHPPCRSWGSFAWRSVASEAEKSLGPLALSVVRRCGGVLEHPASSRLWGVCGVPLGGGRDAFGGWTFPIHQSWFGHRAPKATVLYLVGVDPSALPAIPFDLGYPSGRVEFMGVREREATPLALALWLVAVAGLVS